MTNVEKLDRLGKLGDVRQRLDAESDEDDSKDRRINNATSTQLVAWWTGWTLGDESWGREIVSMYQALEEMK